MTEHGHWQAKWHGLQDILGPKWALHILRLLSEEPHGFNAIRRELDGLTAPMLSQRLKELRCHGLVERRIDETTPPTTIYSLSEQGAQIAEQLRGLESLVELHDRTANNHESVDCADVGGECRSESLVTGCVMAADRC